MERAERKKVDGTQVSAGGGRGREFPLRAFADQRRKYLLNHPEIKKLAK